MYKMMVAWLLRVRQQLQDTLYLQTQFKLQILKELFQPLTAFADLTSTPTTFLGIGITDALSNAGNVDIGSSDFITTGKSYYANMFSALSDLPSATTYHGMFAHVHATGAGYFAHGGNWIELANKSYVDTEVAGIVDSAPGTLNTLNELAAALNDDANFATTVTNSLALKAGFSKSGSHRHTNCSNSIKRYKYYTGSNNSICTVCCFRSRKL